jgi:hypothetical protein
MQKPEEMRTTWLFLVLVTLVAFACSDDSDSTQCSFSDNPESSNLVWLTNEIQEMSENAWMYQFQYVTRARYGPKLVFLFRNCCPNCLSVVPVYDCAGTLLGIVGDDIQVSLLQNEEVFWKPENSVCSLN